MSPTDPMVVAQLAQRYFDLAMARGDPRYVGYAEAVVARFPAPLPASLLTVRGQLRQFGHDFDGALQDFARALALEPALATAHAWRGAIFLVQAQYELALIECKALERLGRRTLHAGCLGLAQAYGGQLGAAQATLQQALDGSQPEQRLWLLTRLGEVAAWRAQPAVAERRYREALALGLEDGYLLAAWSDFLLDAGRPAEVIEWLSSWEASDPLLLRLAEAESALGRPEATRHVQVLEDRFAAARLRGDTTHRAEEARYRLRLRGDAEAALRLAVENYRGQREPRDARILLEAANAAADAQAAAVVRDWLRSSGFEDPRLRQLAQASANRTGSAAGPASGRP
jgi:Tfp pilus assembly protein PilF